MSDEYMGMGTSRDGNGSPRLYDRIYFIGKYGEGGSSLVGKSWVGIGDDGVVDIYLGDEFVKSIHIIDLMIPASQRKEKEGTIWRR